MSIQQTRLPGPIQAIAWNGKGSRVAVSHGGNDVVIYEASVPTAGEPLSWRKVAVLAGHHQMVSDLDWAPKADLILSCSHDRNAFVWTRSETAKTSGAFMDAPGGGAPRTTSASPARGGTRAGPPASTPPSEAAGEAWEKQMVITRLTKGALCVRWSPSEAKFAIGSAARVVSVGYYDSESKWWACKMIRKAHESSVVSVAWHPNSLLLATGSTDRRVRLFNAYVPGYEPEAAAGALPPNSAFGDCLIEVSHEGCGWVHSVVWSPADEALLYASHDAAVGLVRGPQAEVAVRLSGPGQLPLKCLAVVSERVVVGAGWEGCLVVLTRRSQQDPWQLAGALGGSEHGRSGGGDVSATIGGSVVRQLAQMHISGAGAAVTGAKSSGGSAPTTWHTACVTGLHPRRTGAGRASGGFPWHVASAGLDGQIILWDLSSYL